MTAFRGFYINLPTSKTRRQQIEQQLAQFGLTNQYQQVEAIDGATVSDQYKTKLRTGELGNWLSHNLVLADNRKTEHHLHIVEDDILFNPVLAGAFENFQASNQPWDILYTDTYILPTPLGFSRLNRFMHDYKTKKQVRFIKLGRGEFTNFASSSSYFVNKNSVTKLLDLRKNGWEHNIPNDRFVTDLINRGKVNAYLTVPFLTSLSKEGELSTISNPVQETWHARHLEYANYLRKSFYIGMDVDQLRQQVRQTGTRLEVDSRLEIFSEYTKCYLAYLDSTVEKY